MPNETHNEPTPRFEGDALFLTERMPLIDTNDPPKAPTGVVQDLLDYGEIHAEACHAAGASPTKIMEGPPSRRIDLAI